MQARPRWEVGSCTDGGFGRERQKGGWTGPDGFASVGAVTSGERDERDGHGQETRDAQKPERPKLWKVILLNDDFTPREFVIRVLQMVFR